MGLEDGFILRQESQREDASENTLSTKVGIGCEQLTFSHQSVPTQLEVTVGTFP